MRDQIKSVPMSAKEVSLCIAEANSVGLKLAPFMRLATFSWIREHGNVQSLPSPEGYSVDNYEGDCR